MPVLEVVQRAREGKEMVQSAKNLAAYFARHAELPGIVSTPATWRIAEQ